MLEHVLTRTTPLYVGCCEEQSIPRAREPKIGPPPNTDDEDQVVQVLLMYLYYAKGTSSSFHHQRQEKDLPNHVGTINLTVSDIRFSVHV